MVDLVLFVGFFPFVISQRGVWILCWYLLFPFRRALLATLFEFLFDRIAQKNMNIRIRLGVWIRPLLNLLLRLFYLCFVWWHLSQICLRAVWSDRFFCILVAQLTLGLKQKALLMFD